MKTKKCHQCCQKVVVRENMKRCPRNVFDLPRLGKCNGKLRATRPQPVGEKS
jgi:hypothetical protein